MTGPYKIKVISANEVLIQEEIDEWLKKQQSGRKKIVIHQISLDCVDECKTIAILYQKTD